MGKAKKKITNWAENNKALCKRGSVTMIGENCYLLQITIPN